MDDFKMEVDERGNIKVTSYVEAVILSKEEREQARRIFKQLQEENAKLREMADAVKEFVEDTHCEDCPYRRDCDDNNRIFCANDFSYHAFAAMRELGIEVEDA